MTITPDPGVLDCDPPFVPPVEWTGGGSPPGWPPTQWPTENPQPAPWWPPNPNWPSGQTSQCPCPPTGSWATAPVESDSDEPTTQPTVPIPPPSVEWTDGKAPCKPGPDGRWW